MLVQETQGNICSDCRAYVIALYGRSVGRMELKCEGLDATTEP